MFVNKHFANFTGKQLKNANSFFFFFNKSLFSFLSNSQTKLLNSKKINIEVFYKKETNKQTNKHKKKKKRKQKS